MEGVSVIIAFCGRRKHLINTLKGLEQGHLLPDEVILIEMGDTQTELPEFNLDIKCNLISGTKSNYLPMARARNAGAMLSQFETLVFLDVDCIPAEDFIEGIKALQSTERAIYMGLPMYLNNAVDGPLSYEDFKESQEHPKRPSFGKMCKTDDYGLFWSLCFFMNSTLFFELGGFDETYTGYGIEDTDLAWKCKHSNVSFYLTRLKVYHQPHAFQRPPLSNLDSIVKNCNHFFAKWKHWPAEKHLSRFTEMGLIKWDKHQYEPIEIVKLPSSEMYDSALVLNEPFA